MIYINNHNYTEFYDIIFYNKEGKFHREDGPAVFKGDYQAWFLNDKRHRLDGPAVIRDDYQSWWENGKLHRIGGPAIIKSDLQTWWIDGIKYNESDYLAKQEHDLAKQEHDNNKRNEIL